MDGDDIPGTSRRGLLKALAVAGAAAAAVGPAVPAEAKPKGFLVCRLRTRRTRACRACKMHHRYFVYRTAAIADVHRAHPGCDCPIVKQRINRRMFRRYFPGPVRRGLRPAAAATEVT